MYLVDIEEEKIKVDDGTSLSPVEEPIKRLRRKRSGDSNSDLALSGDPNFVALVFDAPGAIASGVQEMGRGLSGLAGKVGIGGDKPATAEPGNGGGFDPGAVAGSISNAVSNVGSGIGKAAATAGDGLGHVVNGAGTVLSGAGEVLSSAGEIAGTVLSAVGDVAGPAAEAAGEIAEGVLGALGDLST